MDYELGDAIRIRIGDGILEDVRGLFEQMRASVPAPDLSVVSGKVGGQGLRVSDTLFVSRGSYRLLHAGTAYEVSLGSIVCDGKADDDFVRYELLPPVMNRILVPKGWCLLHASAVSLRGRNVLMPAMGGTGKTSLLIDFMMRGADFIGDDRVLVSNDGDFVSYPQKLHLLDYNFRVFPELFDLSFRDAEERRRMKRRYSRYTTGLGMREDSVASRLIKTRLTSRYYFEHSAPPKDLFPESSTVVSGRISDVFLLTREEGIGVQDARPDELGPLAAVSTWLDDSAWLHCIASHLSGLPHHSLEDEERALSLAFSHAKCHQVGMGASYDRKSIEAIGEQIRRSLS